MVVYKSEDVDNGERKKVKHYFDKNGLDRIKVRERYALPAYDTRQVEFDYNVGIVRKYGENTYKVSYHKYILKKGCRIEKRGKGTANDKKLIQNVKRAKRTIRDYALCNEWQYFVTLTLDRCKRDRYDLKAYIKALGQRIRDINKSRDRKIAYLLIPEQHKDGAWHMHGFINGLVDKDVTVTNVKGRKRSVYHWIDYELRFGFSDMEVIESKERATSYITKYVSKDMVNSVSEVNAKTYYCSRGLKKPVEIKRGIVTPNYVPQYEKKIESDVVYSDAWFSDASDVIIQSMVNTTTKTETWQYTSVEFIDGSIRQC